MVVEVPPAAAPLRAMGEPGLRVEACSKAVVPILAGPWPVEVPEMPCPAEGPDGASSVKAFADSWTGVLPLMPAT